jgi:hypothetical protein
MANRASHAARVVWRLALQVGCLSDAFSKNIGQAASPAGSHDRGCAHAISTSLYLHSGTGWRRYVSRFITTTMRLALEAAKWGGSSVNGRRNGVPLWQALDIDKIDEMQKNDCQRDAVCSDNS